MLRDFHSGTKQRRLLATLSIGAAAGFKAPGIATNFGARKVLVAVRVRSAAGDLPETCVNGAGFECLLVIG